MKKVISVLLLMLILAAALPLAAPTRAQNSPVTRVYSEFVVNSYGYGVVNETVTYVNNGSSPATVPDVQMSFGNLSLCESCMTVEGSGYSASVSSGASGYVFTVSGGQRTLPPGNSSSFYLKVIASPVTTRASNGSDIVTMLTRPHFDLTLSSLHTTIRMPAYTHLLKFPTGFSESTTNLNVTYSRTDNNVAPADAVTQWRYVKVSTIAEFHPLDVFAASRTIVVSSNGAPLVVDKLSLKNLGTSSLSTLKVVPLTGAYSFVTFEPSAEPPLLTATQAQLLNNALPLSSSLGLSVGGGANVTITFQYPLDQKYYTVSGGSVSLKIPKAPPIGTFVNAFSISLSLAPGVTAGRNSSSEYMTGVPPNQGGAVDLAYSVSAGWALPAGVPLASLLFVIVLAALFASRSSVTEEEESEEESATDRASAMIKAFEEKTSLINSMFPEIESADPNRMNKAYFDELRGRLDAFRSRALQRLNEMKQKSTTQKFFDLLNQIHATEREADRAAKDKLNLYEQFYTHRMRKEVYDRLLPSYSKRLEKALNQLSDELHTVQREAKLL